MYTLQPKYESEYLALGQTTVKYVDTIHRIIENVTRDQEVFFNVTSSIQNAKRLIIVPILSGSGVGANGEAVSSTYFSPLISPFSTEPSTCSPYAITNFQVMLSSVPVYSQFLNFTYEQFLFEMNNFGVDSNLKSGLVSGRISKKHYENNYGYIVVNIGRRLDEEMDAPISIDVQFKQLSLLKMNYYVFVETEKGMTINLLNGSRVM